jgi:CheY-like chemotaxis protein
MNIWLIDDDDITNMLHMILMKKEFPSHNSLVFNLAEKAIDALSSGTNLPDYIFLDINMPFMDGWEFLEELSKINNAELNAVQIYILSSSIDPADFSKAENSTYIKGFISKPLKLEKIAFLKNN